MKHMPNKTDCLSWSYSITPDKTNIWKLQRWRFALSFFSHRIFKCQVNYDQKGKKEKTQLQKSFCTLKEVGFSFLLFFIQMF